MLNKTLLLFVLMNLFACQHSFKQDQAVNLNFKGCREGDGYFTESYQRMLMNQHRSFRAKVSVITETVKDQANMVWTTTQMAEGSEHLISIYGPLGAGATKLEFGQRGAKLTDNKGRQYRRHSAEQLLSEIVEWPIPVEALVYWLMAVPAPNAGCEYQLNDQNQLSVLQQRGWRVRYSKYQPFGKHVLPAKIEAETQVGQQGARVKLIIKSWQWN